MQLSKYVISNGFKYLFNVKSFYQIWMDNLIEVLQKFVWKLIFLICLNQFFEKLNKVIEILIKFTQIKLNIYFLILPKF